MNIKIFTDGSCSGNPGPGGIGGVVLINDIVESTYSVPISQTTNNQTEILAAIYGINEVRSFVTENTVIEIYSDSKYVINGITEWIKNWKLKNWKTKGGTPVLNVELWTELDRLNTSMNINWYYVKGHDGHQYNEMADKLAREATANAKQSIK